MSVQQLGRYEITGKLGEGAMGIVYHAFDPLLERDVAIKTVKLELTPAEQEEFEQRFFKEAKSAARLNHPNIVTVFDAGKVEDTAYIAMEFMEGRDLRQMIVSDQSIPHDRIAEIVIAVADGLDYAHRNGVVHRDIKPANIMVLDNGEVKIADFGIAQLQSGTRTATGHVMGTPKYMSPEQIMGIQVDGRSDIFSLGIVLYQMLTAVSPFDSSSISAVMYKVIHEPALMPSLIAQAVPLGFEYILARALAKAPEKRYQTAGEMADDLRRYKEFNDIDAIPWDGSALARPEYEVGRIVDITRNGDDTEFTYHGAASLEHTAKRNKHPAPDTRNNGTPQPTHKLTSAAAKNRFRALAVSGIALLAITVIAFIATMENGKSSSSAPEATPSETATVTAPPATPAGKATLTFAITPWGEVFVDGISRGASPPISEVTVAAGKHLIEVRNPGQQSLTQELDIKDGESQKIKHKF